MPEPVEYRNEYVESASGTPPPPPGYPPAPAGRRAVVTSATVTPAGFRARQTVWVIIAVVDVILALRFVFYAAGANDVGFAHVVYAIGAALDAPFRGIFSTSLTPGDHPLQWADVLAAGIYGIAALIVDRIILIASTPSSRHGMTAPS